MSVKTQFSIKDLENLSGIKAHTIRIWEKRYNILEPMRTDTNIRFYDIKNLQKLLNITTLHNFGYKISAISKMPPEKLPVLVKEILSKNNLADQKRTLVNELVAELATAIASGRSNPGPKQSNEGWPSTFHPRVLARFPTLAAPVK